MGYDLHITKGESWTDSEDNPIPLDEWRAVVERDPHLEAQEFAEATNPRTGEVIRMETPGAALWTDPASETVAFLGYRNGKISVKTPDEQTIAKMNQVALQFGARVLGDENEEY